MSMSISSSPGASDRLSRMPALISLRKIFNKRTFIGFKVGEGLLWLAFNCMWPVVLGSLYFAGGIFENENFITLKQFIIINIFVVSTKVSMLIPFWWLFFVKLKNMRLSARFLLHIPASCLYAGLVLTTMYNIRIRLLDEPYLINQILSDSYTILFGYFFHFFLFHAYNFWLHTQRQHRKEQELQQLAFQSEINALKTQIEPHFLFNTLNSISASVPPSLEKTRILIAQLADTFRYALRVSERQMVPLGDEIEFIKTWLALEKHRFGDRLIIHYKIDGDALDIMVPPMILQPIIENALNHGISPKVNGGTVTIECTLQDKFVHVSVSDTGVGYAGDIDQILNKSVGLSNISRRLRLLYDEPVQVVRNQQGLTFSFKVPFDLNHEKKSAYNR
jgi:two-component system, LytTR family, sensor kinase